MHEPFWITKFPDSYSSRVFSDIWCSFPDRRFGGLPKMEPLPVADQKRLPGRRARSTHDPFWLGVVHAVWRKPGQHNDERFRLLGRRLATAGRYSVSRGWCDPSIRCVHDVASSPGFPPALERVRSAHGLALREVTIPPTGHRNTHTRSRSKSALTLGACHRYDARCLYWEILYVEVRILTLLMGG